MPTAVPKAYLYLATIVAAYIGVYLCRKNFSVAVPILQNEWGVTKEQLGLVGSVSTMAYACGKLLLGPLTDRLGGRLALLGSMAFVAVFGAMGALSSSILPLLLLYSMNRFAGAASWGAMVKLVPEWFSPGKLAFACGLMSLSFVFGGALAVSLGGLVAQVSGDSAVAVLAVPSVVLLALVVFCAVALPHPRAPRLKAEAAAAGDRRSLWRDYTSLFLKRQFLIVIALSFALTMVREVFNLWTVDLMATEGGPDITNAMAAFVSTPFDLCGAAGIVLMGWQFDRLGKAGRRNLLLCVMLALSVVLLALPAFFSKGLWALGAGVGLIGFLVYGPYSLLGGVFSVEVRGKEYAATVSGIVDGAGYLAGMVSGVIFGRLLSAGGYRLGFEVMAIVTLAAAVLCCFLYGRTAPAEAGTPEFAPTS